MKDSHPLIRGILMLIALATIAISINMFFAPHNVAAGGATGIAILIHETFGIAVGMTTLAINLVMLILAFTLINQATARRILIGSLLLPIFLFIVPSTALIQNRILAIIIGSVIFAFGVSLNYHIDASSGGTTVPPMIFQKYFHLKPSIGLFATDLVVCLFNIPASGMEAFLLAIMSIGITGGVMHAIEWLLSKKSPTKDLP